MKLNTLVSIIIPCYNQAQYLEEAVLSVVNQTYENIEIIIVNDGSPDNTQKIAEGLQNKHPEKIQIITQENSGLYAARNNGIKKSSGYYIVPLDADDKLDREMVTKCIQMIQENNSDIVYTGYQGFGASDRVNMWKPFEETNPLYFTPCSATALFRRKVWETTGGYKSSMHDGYEDWEFWINAYKHNFIFYHLNEKLFLYRIKEESMFTEAFKKDAYLKAKITMNHPELYTIQQVGKAIKIIKETEDLADFYFYLPHNEHKLDQDTLHALDHYLTSHNLSNMNHIIIDNKDLKLYALDSFKNFEGINKILEQNDPDKIVFYAPLRYSVPGLKNADFAWKNDVMVDAKATKFSYVFKEIRENTESQLLAHRRLERYHEYIQNKLNNLQRKYDNDKNNANRKLKDLAYKYNTLEKKYNTLEKKYNTLEKKYDSLMDTLSDITKAKTFKSPLQKISAYKRLLALYHKYR